MKAKQLSVFLENKSGRLTEVTEALGKANINLSAMSIADNSDFGILRCIVSEPERAYQVLKEAGFAVKMTDVIALNCPNTSGSLAVVLDYLSSQGVFIEYLYSFAAGDRQSNKPRFLKKVMQKFGRYKKTPYLCIAFQKDGRLAQLV